MLISNLPLNQNKHSRIFISCLYDIFREYCHKLHQPLKESNFFSIVTYLSCVLVILKQTQLISANILLLLCWNSKLPWHADHWKLEFNTSLKNKRQINIEKYFMKSLDCVLVAFQMRAFNLIIAEKKKFKFRQNRVKY